MPTCKFDRVSMDWRCDRPAGLVLMVTKTASSNSGARHDMRHSVRMLLR